MLNAIKNKNSTDEEVFDGMHEKISKEKKSFINISV